MVENVRSRWLLLFVLGVFLLCVDLGSKYLIFSSGGGQLNEGAAFGILPGFFWPLVMVVILAGVFWSLLRVESWWQRVGLVLVLVGGVGNLVDRVVYGAVVDFICYPIIGVCGNMADIFIVVGAVVLILRSTEYGIRRT